MGQSPECFFPVDGSGMCFICSSIELLKKIAIELILIAEW